MNSAPGQKGWLMTSQSSPSLSEVTTSVCPFDSRNLRSPSSPLHSVNAEGHNSVDTAGNALGAETRIVSVRGDCADNEGHNNTGAKNTCAAVAKGGGQCRHQGRCGCAEGGGTVRDAAEQLAGGVVNGARRWRGGAIGVASDLGLQHTSTEP
eukprot:485394-Pyramimonas_sp.AAC.3